VRVETFRDGTCDSKLIPIRVPDRRRGLCHLVPTPASSNFGARVCRFRSRPFD